MPDGMFTSVLEEDIADWAFDGVSMPTPPSDLYLALHSDHPTNEGTENELDASDYDRQHTEPADWTRLTGNNPTVVENNVDIGFGVADEDWGTVTHFSLHTDPSVDEPLFWGELDAATEVNQGDEYVVRAGNGAFEVS